MKEILTLFSILLLFSILPKTWLRSIINEDRLTELALMVMNKIKFTLDDARNIF